MKTEVTMMTPSGKAFTNNKPTLLKYGREFGINSEYKFPNTITPTNNNALVPVSSSFNDVKKYETPKNPYLKKSRQASSILCEEKFSCENHHAFVSTSKSSSNFKHSEIKQMNDYSIFTQHKHDRLQEEMKTAVSLQITERKPKPRPSNPYIKKHCESYDHEPSERQHTFMKMRMQLKELEAKKYREQLQQMEYERMMRFDSYPYNKIDEDELIPESMTYDLDRHNGCHKIKHSKKY